MQQNNPRKFLERSETAISEQHLNPKMLIVKKAEELSIVNINRLRENVRTHLNNYKLLRLRKK